MTGNSPLNARPSTSSLASAASLPSIAGASVRSATAIVQLLRHAVGAEMRLIVAHQRLKVPVGILEEEAPRDAGDDLRCPIFKAGDAVAHRSEARDGTIVEDMDAAKIGRRARHTLAQLEGRAEIGKAGEDGILLAGRRR